MRLNPVLCWILLTALWTMANQARVWISPHCVQSATACLASSVLNIDELSIGMESVRADQYSYWTQNTSGMIAFFWIFIWSFVCFFNDPGTNRAQRAWKQLGSDLLTFLTAVSLNGFLTECSHLIGQRPRPFVYLDPLHRGLDPNHYTSFYSGHSSFAATAHIIALLILKRRGAPNGLLTLMGVFGFFLTFATAHFRILAGRHFLTDVMCGILGGSLAAWLIEYWQFRCERSQQKV